MMRNVIVFALLSFAAGVQLSAEDQEWKERPVSKVINMLKEMQAELQNEAELDEEAYDKMTCYCETNDREKTKAIADAEARITSLTNSIEALTAKEATLTREVEALNKEIAENQAGLAKSTDIRRTEKAEFVEDEKNMIVSITGLKSAVTVLGKHHDSALNQEKMTSLIQTLKITLRENDFKKVLASHKERRLVTSFLQTGSTERQAPSAGSYAPQSGAIFGVLKQMKEQFEGSLNSATSEEKKAEEEFQNMKAAKTEEIAASTNKVSNKETEIGDTAEKNAADQQDLADTQAALAADTEFLANLKAQCSALDKEYEMRTKTRTEEIAAVADTIGILTDDDAHDQFSKSLGFAQVKQASTVKRVATSLRSAAAKASDPRLSALAVSVALNPFEMVKDKVEQMISDLQAEAQEEVKKRDECTADLHQNGVDTEAKYAEKDDLNTSIDDLTNTVSNIKSDIDTLNAEVAEMKVQMKRASEDREIENKDFQETIADQRASQAILEKALARLEVFYAQKSFLQERKAARESQNPGSFQKYEKSEKSGGVMAMIQGVIDESKALENDAIAAEQDSQAGYEQYIVDSNKSIAAKEKDIASKTEEMGKQDAALTVAKGDLKNNLADLESLHKINTQLHDSCDFLMNNFETRVEARELEIEALSQSVAMLSGAK